MQLGGLIKGSPSLVPLRGRLASHSMGLSMTDVTHKRGWRSFCDTSAYGLGHRCVPKGGGGVRKA